MKIVGNNPITYLFLFLYLCFPVTSYPSPSELDLKPKIERINSTNIITESPGDSKKIEGLFNLHWREDKLYLEILPEQLGKDFLLHSTLWTSIPDTLSKNITPFHSSGIYFPERVFSWVKRNKELLFLWRNTRYIAKKSAELKRALKNVTPNSIAHVYRIDNNPQPKSYMVCLDDLLFSDLNNLADLCQSALNHPFSVNKEKTVWGHVKAFPENVELEVLYTLSSPEKGYEPGVPDPRLFTISVHFSISALPENNGYKPRPADDRIGYAYTKIFDFDSSELDGVELRYIHRWHLEKKDSKARVSEPKEPIVFWLENTIPPEYREPVREGVLLWNRAFEKAGFRNAIVVKQMPDEAEWDPSDIRYSMIRWVPVLKIGEEGHGSGFHQINPFTGQILKADVILFAPFNFIFNYNALNSPLNHPIIDKQNTAGSPTFTSWHQDNIMLNIENDFAILEMLADGRINDIKDVPEEYIFDFIRYLTCHEVGHALGLRHNFKGSTTIALKDLHNTVVTGKESIGNSVMDYLPLNLAPKGTLQGDYRPKTIGAYDYWAIEYGYLPIETDTSTQEIRSLNQIASRSIDPLLTFGTDDDAYDIGSFSTIIDPLCVPGDLSSDPLSYTEQEINRIKDLWDQLEGRALFEGRSYSYLRRAFELSLYKYSQAMYRTLKWIGGIYHSRVHVGDSGKVLPYKVVEYEKQIRALNIIIENLLNTDAFDFEPAFIQKLQIDRFFDSDREHQIMKEAQGGNYRLDFSLSYHLELIYQKILDMLLDPVRLRRIQDNETRVEKKTLTLSGYISTLHASIWIELKGEKSIGALRRVLQEKYLDKIINISVSPPPQFPYDAVALCWYQLKELDRDIKNYLKINTEIDQMTRVHLELCSDIISKAFKKT